MWQVGPPAALEQVGQGLGVTHIVPLQCPMNCAVPDGGFLEVTEVRGYMGGPARLAGPQGAMRSLSKLITTLQALAYSEAQASLYSKQCLHSYLFALHLLNAGQNYRAVADRTMLK